MSDSTLKELWQQVAEKKSCEAKQKELTAQRDTLADRLKKLEKSKLAEQADVDRLEGHSLATFFYQVIGKMDEKLDKERQEAYAARVKYDVALHDLSSVDADLEQIQNRLARLSDCERQYQAALSEKIKSIKASAHPAAQLVAESESRIAALKVQKRELLEAINAGKTALHTVNEVLETLDNAEGWSTWDVMGGGLMADLAKYEELDDAQEQIEAVLANFDDADIVIKAAAVADYTPANKQTGKMKKGDDFALELVRTTDILKELGAKKNGQVLVGFSAETSDLEKNAQGKLKRKNLDMIVANDVSRSDIGFGTDENAVTIYFADGRVEQLEKAPKSQIASSILDFAHALL